MIGLSLRAIALALRGEVVGAQVLAPGPGHSAKDRSLTVRLSPSAPDGFLVFSHAGDDFKACKDHVRRRLGLERSDPRRPIERSPVSPVIRDDKSADRTAGASALWKDSIDPRGTLAERYLASRGLGLDADVAGETLRWNPRLGAMIALFRNIGTGEPQAISRTFLGKDGRKIERKFLGPVGGAAIMLDAFDTVTTGLHIGEGVETCLAARRLGLRPCWALGSAGAIEGFPILSGIGALTLLREHDDANRKAADACAMRWHIADRKVFDIWPNRGNDVNDAIRGAA